MRMKFQETKKHLPKVGINKCYIFFFIKTKKKYQERLNSYEKKKIKN